jgi:hypothetical protein
MLQALLGGSGGSAVGQATGVITQATWTSGDTTYYGFDSTHGSSTGTSLPGSRTLNSVYYYFVYDGATGELSYGAVMTITGFGADPGALGYFSNMTVAGGTLSAADAVYSYSLGAATWAWSYAGWPLTGSGTADWTMT